MEKKKRITLATVKSFIRKNLNDLYINVESSFDGMTDCCEPCHDGFKKAKKCEWHLDRTLGVNGAWFVGGSRDYFDPYDNGEYVGYMVFNSCGSFILAVKK